MEAWQLYRQPDWVPEGPPSTGAGQLLEGFVRILERKGPRDAPVDRVLLGQAGSNETIDALVVAGAVELGGGRS